MNQVRRFNVYGQMLDDGMPLGEPYFVQASDYDALAAKLDSIEARAEQSTEYVLAQINKDLRDENERLRADIDEDGEQLTRLARKLTEAKRLLREARERTEFIGTLYGDLYIRIDAFLADQHTADAATLASGNAAVGDNDAEGK